MSRRDRRYDGGSSRHRHDGGRDRHDGGRERHGRHGSYNHHDGDWICAECGNNNFARRKQCNKCGEEKPFARTKSGGIEIGKHLAEKSKGLFAADDWQCKMCGNVNWSRRNECNVCKAPKVGCVESRTGYGGGFNERENVEYNDKQDSDGEYDEFGRKKKKFRGTVSEDTRDINKSKEDNNYEKDEENDDEEEDDEEGDDDEEDDESGDSDAYKLSDEDEDDDDENDVSAYDLGNSDDDNNDDAKAQEQTNERFKQSPDFIGRNYQPKKRERSRSRSSERDAKKFAES